MLENEINELFNHRTLNSKSNNFIFTRVSDFSILNNIPKRCNISTPSNNINVDYAYNIKIDLLEVDVKSSLSYVLQQLKNLSLLNNSLDYTFDFNSQFDLYKLNYFLRTQNIVVQLIFYNLDEISLKEQALINEIYNFNSIFFNANSFIKGDDFETYRLSAGRVLTDPDNYKKIELSQLNFNNTKNQEKQIIKK